MKMLIQFATLGLIATIIMSSVSAGNVPKGNTIATSNHIIADQVRAGLTSPVKRTSLSRRKVASLLERRRKICDHSNHRSYHDGDDYRRHYRPHHRHCGSGSGYCGDSDDYDDYNDEHDYDDDDYYECDECDDCDEDGFGYISWEDYDDETT